MAIQTFTLESLREKCPSIFATRPSPKVSERYTFVSTADVIRPLLSEGWDITQAFQRRTRPGGRNPEFTRHLVRLRRADAKSMLGDVLPEVVISNSHDRQSRFFIAGGLFRLVCSNGLVIGFGGKSTSAKMIHLGDAARIREAIDQSLTIATACGKQIEGMSKKKLSEKDQARFAAAAAKIAYDDQKFDPKLLLTSRRSEDEANDLWTVYNRIQENIVRGGVKYDKNGDREITTRGITHIGRTLELNTALWDTAVQFLPKAA
jgi:hypothetical protein